MDLRGKELASEAEGGWAHRSANARQLVPVASILARRVRRIAVIVVAVSVAVVTAALPAPRTAMAKDSQSKATMSCRSVAAQQAQKAMKTTLSAIAKCQASRLRGKIPASADCSDLSVADVKDKIPRGGNASESKLRASLDKKCGPSDPSRPLHPEGDIAGSVLAVVDQAVAYAHSAIGQPEPDVPKDALKCQKTVSKTGTKLLTALLKETAKCQKRTTAM